MSDKPDPITVHGYLTLEDSTLVDFEQQVPGLMRVRAGKSLEPAKRPIVFQLTPRDAREMILSLLSFTQNAYGATANVSHDLSDLEYDAITLLAEATVEKSRGDDAKWTTMFIPVFESVITKLKAQRKALYGRQAG